MKIVMPIKEFTRTLYFEVFLKFKANTHSFLLSNCSIMFMSVAGFQRLDSKVSLLNSGTPRTFLRIPFS